MGARQYGHRVWRPMKIISPYSSPLVFPRGLILCCYVWTPQKVHHHIFILTPWQAAIMCPGAIFGQATLWKNTIYTISLYYDCSCIWICCMFTSHRFGPTWYMLYWLLSSLSWVSINLLTGKMYLFNLSCVSLNYSLDSIKQQGWGVRKTNKRTTCTVDVTSEMLNNGIT